MMVFDCFLCVGMCRRACGRMPAQVTLPAITFTEDDFAAVLGAPSPAAPRSLAVHVVDAHAASEFCYGTFYVRQVRGFRLPTCSPKPFCNPQKPRTPGRLGAFNGA